MSLWGGVDYDDDSLDNSLHSLQIDFDLEKCLANAQQDSDAARQQLQKALIEAAQNGKDELIRDILSSEKATALMDVNFRDEAGKTALVYASCFGHESTVAELLRFGAGPDLQDNNEWTALMWAVNNNHLGIVKQLLAANANVDIKTSTGRTAFDLPMSPDSVTYMSLSSNGYIKNAGASRDTAGFYEKAIDPDEIEQQFNNTLKESAAALGGFGAYTVSEGNQTLDDADVDGTDMILAAPLLRSTELVPDFDWKQYKHSDSFPIPKEFVPEFLDIVITNFQPTLQKNQNPVSANALFMVCRYFFYEGNTESFTAFSSPLGRRIELAIQDEKHSGDLAYLSYWLVNSEALLYYLRKDKGIAEATTADLQPTFEQLIQDISDSIQQAAHKLLAPLMVPCLLDYDSIPEYGKVEYRDEWKIFKSNKSGNKNDDDDLEDIAQKHMLPPSYEVLMKNPGPQRVTSVLSSLLLLFQIYGVHSVTQAQIIAKLLYFLSSRMFNRIVRSRKYLNRRRAMQIRLNVSVLEDWCRNNSFRPQSLEAANGKLAVRYKSLIDVGRTVLAPLVQILAWLQTFSGFGSDFTNVVSTLQELKAVTPKQLLKTATHYRFETRESPLSKDYKHYLRDLANHYDRVSATPHAPLSSGESSEVSSVKSRANSEPNDTGNLMNAPAPESMIDLSEPALELTPHDSQEVKSCVRIEYELPFSDDVLLNTDLHLDEHIPGLQESDQFWGNDDTSGVYESQGARFFVPQVSVGIREAVAKQLEEREVESALQQMHDNEVLSEPKDAIGRPEGFEEDDDGEDHRKNDLHEADPWGVDDIGSVW